MLPLSRTANVGGMGGLFRGKLRWLAFVAALAASVFGATRDRRKTVI